MTGAFSAAKRSYPTSEVRGGSRDELPRIQGQGWWPGGATPCPSPVAAAERTYPTPEARVPGPGEQPHLQEAVADSEQEGLQELFHVQGQKGWQ